MRFLLLTLVLAAGCITRGSKSGISPEAEQQLETLGPKFNAQFQLDGSSLSLERYRQLDVRARSNAFVGLPAEAQVAQAREMARWLWQHYGREANLEGIRIRAVQVVAVPAATSPVYRFSKTELARFYP